MGSSAKKPNFMTHGSPIQEGEHEGEYFNHYEEPESSTGCGCFRLFGFGLSRSNESGHLLQEGGRCSGMTWWSKNMSRIKVTSEVLAGPKWKNFIRKIGGYWKGKKERNRFQYDPHSYALNFDGGNGREEEENLLLGFSARFAAPSVGENRHTGSL
ncbi:uncharacterized protein LOC107427817 [Ziziphus jujuba]|uniref:Uncharacterized protein LOC107427817 n=2 Tax=Ziziphus jujuba TaxID=326968 RepID=A0A6P4AGE5_ZIZJJ|nr:uncharacterized protein LOC107427817 [Ziziphus jujuba]KAH7546255.1 hypothetical protein FEM48_Zijuj01G0180900 [Ziziphus jujuba var. spinosa]